ncbi:unnamed protein product [Rhizophagus irregularis]|nr:unnamed protein product [Rhizophagus irregularis]
MDFVINNKHTITGSVYYFMHANAQLHQATPEVRYSSSVYISVHVCIAILTLPEIRYFLDFTLRHLVKIKQLILPEITDLEQPSLKFYHVILFGKKSDYTLIVREIEKFKFLDSQGKSNLILLSTMTKSGSPTTEADTFSDFTNNKASQKFVEALV